MQMLCIFNKLFIKRMHNHTAYNAKNQKHPKSPNTYYFPFPFFYSNLYKNYNLVLQFLLVNHVMVEMNLLSL